MHHMQTDTKCKLHYVQILIDDIHTNVNRNHMLFALRANYLRKEDRVNENSLRLTICLILLLCPILDILRDCLHCKIYI